MKDFFCELFEYNHYFNQKAAEILTAQSQIVTSKATELFSHSLSAHQIWNSRILASQKSFAVWQIHEASDYKNIDQGNYKSSLAIIQNCNLEEIISCQNTKGDTFTNNVRDILF